MSVETKERIHNLIPPPIQPAPRHVRHKSKFSDSVRREVAHSKSINKTMGPAKVPMNPPVNFLKKHSKEPTLPAPGKTTISLESRKPIVPEPPQLAKRSTKNFVTTNALANITAVPKKPTPKYVDSPTGKSQDLEKSGLLPKFVKKDDYGQVPTYLEQRKQEMEEAQAEYARYIKESMEKGQMLQITGNDRKEILDGLKSNWEKLHREYQGLSVVTDTPAKKARKERMESEMKQLEKDIELIERHPIIYVENETAYDY